MLHTLLTFAIVASVAPNPYPPIQGRRSGSNPASLGNSSSSTLRNFLAIPANAPLMDGILGTRYSVHSTGGSSGSSDMRRLGAPGAAGSSGASMLTPVGSMPLGMGPSSSQGVSTESSGMNRLSIDGRIVTAGLSSSAAGTDSSSMGAMHGYTGGTQGTGSGSGEGRASGSAGSSGGRQTVAERYAGITSLLKARSDIAVLRELKIGPLLGRGSYGRVYRGKPAAAVQAVVFVGCLSPDLMCACLLSQTMAALVASFACLCQNLLAYVLLPNSYSIHESSATQLCHAAAVF
jgi:hypothetical protein